MMLADGWSRENARNAVAAEVESIHYTLELVSLPPNDSLTSIAYATIRMLKRELFGVVWGCLG